MKEMRSRLLDGVHAPAGAQPAMLAFHATMLI